MRRLWIAGALSGLLAAEPVHGQFVIGPPGGGVYARGGYSFGISSQQFSRYGYGGQSSFYGYGLPPIGFYGSSYGGPWASPPIVFVQAPPPVIFIQPPLIVPARAEEVRDEVRVPDPKRFIVIRPDKPSDPLPRVEKKPKDPLPARVEKKPMEVDLGIKSGEFPLAAGKAANPRVEADRQIEMGRESFDKSQFGRALDRFRRATVIAPEEATSWFNLAQAQFAAGKYDDAVTSISEGMKRRPDWPQSRFRSRDLYLNLPATYDVHLRDLRTALEADRNDPRLLFLLGVELWFDGRRDEATPLFERAAKRADEPALAEAFLKK